MKQQPAESNLRKRDQKFNQKVQLKKQTIRKQYKTQKGKGKIKPITQFENNQDVVTLNNETWNSDDESTVSSQEDKVESKPPKKAI